MNEPIIAVATLDGPAGSGKGAVGQRLARNLNWHFLDSGALYRACAYLVDTNKIELSCFADQLQKFKISTVLVDGGSDTRVLLNGEDITAKVRTAECGTLASKLAAKLQVRKALLKMQRRLRQPPGLVADGRDMGTVVFPDATAKIYLTADAEIRAKRKYKQLKLAGNYVKLECLYKELIDRDRRDSTRVHAPLAVSPDAFLLDTTNIALEQVVSQVTAFVQSKLD